MIQLHKIEECIGKTIAGIRQNENQEFQEFLEVSFLDHTYIRIQPDTQACEPVDFRFDFSPEEDRRRADYLIQWQKDCAIAVEAQRLQMNAIYDEERRVYQIKHERAYGNFTFGQSD